MLTKRLTEPAQVGARRAIHCIREAAPACCMAESVRAAFAGEGGNPGRHTIEALLDQDFYNLR